MAFTVWDELETDGSAPKEVMPNGRYLCSGVTVRNVRRTAAGYSLQVRSESVGGWFWVRLTSSPLNARYLSYYAQHSK